MEFNSDLVKKDRETINSIVSSLFDIKSSISNIKYRYHGIADIEQILETVSDLEVDFIYALRTIDEGES